MYDDESSDFYEWTCNGHKNGKYDDKNGAAKKLVDRLVLAQKDREKNKSF